MAKRIVLVGLPGSGKSTVGPLVAAELQWEFVDLDDEIVRAAGRTIPQIFSVEGEAGFRARERAATLALAERGPLVLAPGGGWALNPANREALGAEASVVYLKVSPAVAAARMGAAATVRPLLAGGDTRKSLTQMLEARESVYLQSNHTLSVDSLTPDGVAALIVALASA